MKVGDLVKVDHDGVGIVTQVDNAKHTAFVQFVNTKAYWLIWGIAEVLNEGR